MSGDMDHIYLISTQGLRVNESHSHSLKSLRGSQLPKYHDGGHFQMLAPPPIPTPAHTREKVKHALVNVFGLLCSLPLSTKFHQRKQFIIQHFLFTIYITFGEFYQLCFLIDIKCWGISSSYTLVDNVTRSIQNWWLDLEGFFNFYFLFGSVVFLF